MRVLANVVASMALACAALVAQAAEIKVLTAGAYKAVLLAEQAAFEQRTGHTLKVQNDTAGALAKRIQAGEAFDLVVLTPSTLEELARAGAIAPGSGVPLARVGIGLAVKQGWPVPDIATVEGFRAALLAARSVAYIDPAAGGSSGIYLAGLFERMGIADRIKPKAVLVPGGLTAERVVSGQAEMAVQQMSELVAVPGVAIAGPLPAAVQNYTVYAGAIGSRATEREAAAQLLSALQAPALRSVLEAKGLLAP